MDDEPMALRDLQQALAEAAPSCGILPFSSPGRALEQAKDASFHVAFLDIEMGVTSGLVLAKQLKDLQPDIHIIFVTSHAQYAVDAFRLHATGYLMKPALAEDIRRELTFLYGEGAPPGKKARVQTFGGFEVFADERPLQFRRSKAKELLALLIDRRGASLTMAEACAVLWEDEAGSQSQKSYLRTVVTELKATLHEAGIEDILIKRHNSLAIDPEKLDCDSYRFLEGDPQAVNSYRHDYLLPFSWAEFSVSLFDQNR
ncbi:MAG TPA: response regulator [Feifaniaceae bacterium]|nr:response regulator [Feifaniaceae bacterium]